MGKRLCKLFMVLGLIVCSFSAYDVGVKGDSVIEIKNLSEINKSGDYKLSEDSSLLSTFTITKGMKVSLDFNGHTLTVGKPLKNEVGTWNDPDELETGIVNEGSLTLENSNNNKFAIESNAQNTILNEKSGQLTINSGKYQVNKVGYLNNGSYNARMIRSLGDLVINDCEINSKGGAIVTLDGSTTVINNGAFHSTSSSKRGNLYTYCINNNGTMTINNATVTGIQGALAGSAGDLKVYGGNYSTDWNNPLSFYALYVAGETGKATAHIYGGVFSSKRVGAYIGNSISGDGGIMADANIVIEGGTFVGETKAISLDKVTTKDPKIMGGSFYTSPSQTGLMTPWNDVENFIDKGECGLINGTVFPKKATSAALDKTTMKIQLGETGTFKLMYKPNMIFDNTVVWESSKPSIASVKDGVVTSIKAGTTTISATVGGIKASGDVTVFEKPAVEQPPVLDQSKPVDQVTPGVINNPKTEQSINETSTAIINGDFQNYTDAQTAANVKAAIEKGESITTSITTQQMKENEITAPDLKELKRELKALSTKNDSPMLVAQYLDLGVMLKANKNSLGNMTSLVSPISFQVLLPEDLLKEGRTFGVIRIHDGLAELLKATCKDNQLLFESNLFSTYAIVYYDAKEVEKEPVVKDPIVKDPVKKDPVVKEPIIKDSTAKAPTKTPDTFDSTNMIGYVLMLLLAGSTIGVVLVLNKKKKASH
ncbi:MAG: hypothetical protein RSA96_06645 [Erysipelotrichaceae bacterium]